MQEKNQALKNEVRDLKREFRQKEEALRCIANLCNTAIETYRC